jgi:hypothetical protein
MDTRVLAEPRRARRCREGVVGYLQSCHPLLRSRKTRGCPTRYCRWFCLDGGQGLVQIRDDIFHVFDAHGDAHHAVG